jgi:general L-amino acid transport system permease protein
MIMPHADLTVTVTPKEATPKEARTPSRWTRQLIWARNNLFSSWLSTAATLALAYLVARGLVTMIDWGILRAVWSVSHGDSTPCRAVQGIGACWAVVGEKYRFILFGTYPYADQWRPALSVALFIVLYGLSGWRSMWRRELFLIWIAGLLAIMALMGGGMAGLSYVPAERWGGLPVTLILATVGLVAAFPLAIFAALGRASTMPVVRWLCVAYVELIRGVPLISLLFVASVIFPLFMPEGVDFDKLARAQIALILFAGAYLSEVIRGGLQSVGKSQYEAADALGLGYWQMMALIVLPQTLRRTIPPLVNTFIALFKDTSLVLIIGIFDLLSAAKTAISEPAWQGFGIEVYLVVAAIYFAFCFAMSRYSRSLEHHLRVAERG